MNLTEFDKTKTAILNPHSIVDKIEGFPKIGVTCFSKKLIDKVLEAFEHEQISEIKSANGGNPVYKLNYKGNDITFFMSSVGAPQCVVAYEELMAMGLEKLVMFGTCGVLDKDIEDMSIIIPTSAIRDEGTSYHYLEASKEVEVNDKYRELFIELLNEHNYSYAMGKTWTTDAPYRETVEKMNKRREQGAISVEMECASMASVAKFRNKDFFQFLYAADNLDCANWDPRSLGNSINLDKKEQIALLALELAIRLG